MKKLKTWSMMMLAVLALPVMVACGGDDDDDATDANKKTVTLTDDDLTEYGYFDGDMYYEVIDEDKLEIQVSRARKDIVTAIIPKQVKINGVTYMCTTVGHDAFHSCKDLTSVTIPESVTTIKNSGFNNCSSLTAIDFPASVKTFEANIVHQCTKMASVTVRNTDPTFAKDAFYSFKGLQEFHIMSPNPPSGDLFRNTAIGAATLYVPKGSGEKYWAAPGWNDFKAIVEKDGDKDPGVEIPRPDKTVTLTDADKDPNYTNVYTDGELKYALGGQQVELAGTVSKDIKTADIPKYVVINGGTYTCAVISGSSFKGCTSLTTVKIPNSVKYIRAMAFQGCTSLLAVTIPGSVTEIGNDCFNGCTSLSSVNFSEGDGLSFKGEYVFRDCTSLTSMDFPAHVKSFVYQMFQGCSKLSSVTIRCTDPTFFMGAFLGMTALKEFHVRSQEPKTPDDGSLFSVTDIKSATLYVPKGSLSAYQKAAHWKLFGNIVEE